MRSELEWEISHSSMLQRLRITKVSASVSGVQMLIHPWKDLALSNFIMQMNTSAPCNRGRRDISVWAGRVNHKPPPPDQFHLSTFLGIYRGEWYFEKSHSIPITISLWLNCMNRWEFLAVLSPRQLSSFTRGYIVFIYSRLLLCWHICPVKNLVANQEELVSEPPCC